MGAIHLTVMIEIMLHIVLLTIDAAAFHLLRMMQACAFFLGYDTIRLGIRLHLINPAFLTFQSIGFTLRQCARRLALLDTTLLIGLTLINDWRLRLSESGKRDD